MLKRCVILALPQGDQPKKVVNDEGEHCQSYQDGLAIRKETIKNKLSEKGINFPAENIFFYDGKRHIHNDRYVTEDIDRAVEERKDSIAKIEKIVQGRKNLGKIIDSFEEKVDRIVDFNPTQEDERLLVELLKRFDEISPPPTFDSFGKPFSDFYGEKFHHMTMHAMHIRGGKYYDASIPLEIKQFTSRKLSKVTEHFLKAAKSILANIKPSSDGLSAITEELYSVSRANSIQLQREISDTLVEILFQDQLNPESGFWVYQQNEFGKGQGYKDRVGKRFQKVLSEMDSYLNDMIQEQWRSKLVKPLLKFLAEDYFYA